MLIWTEGKGQQTSPTPSVEEKINLSLLASARGHGGTMSRGTRNGIGTKSKKRGKEALQMDAFAWLSNLKVGGTAPDATGNGKKIGAALASRRIDRQSVNAGIEKNAMLSL